MVELEGWQMTFTEFNKRFESNMTEAPTYKEAYYTVENEHIELTGVQRFSGYDSFKVNRWNHLKSKKT
jgi:hypothetical protein